jgi:hypothetical protein
MSGVNVRTLDNPTLWHIVFAPFVDERDKEVARKELGRRGCYAEPIVEVRAEDK